MNILKRKKWDIDNEDINIFKKGNGVTGQNDMKL